MHLYSSVYELYKKMMTSSEYEASHAAEGDIYAIISGWITSLTDSVLKTEEEEHQKKP